MILPDYRRAWHGRTWPEATHYAGWAAWKYKRERVLSPLLAERLDRAASPQEKQP